MKLCSVSVIIPCYNHGEYILEALESVLKSTYADFEVIIVDDGSNDPQTLSVLDKIEGFGYETVRVLRQQNKGLPGARNAGIRAAKGEFIVPLDSDDLLDPTFLEKTVWCALRNADIGLVFTDVKLFGDVNHVWKVPDFTLENLLRENLIASCALFPKKVWESLCGYDESYVHGYEDWEFWIRIALKGYRFVQIREPLFFYRKHGTSMLTGSNKKHNALVKGIRSKHPYRSQSMDVDWRMFLRSLYLGVRPYLPRTLNNLLKLLYYRVSVPRRDNALSPDILLFEELLRTFRYSPIYLPIIRETIDRKIKVMFILPHLEVGGVESLHSLLLTELPKDVEPIVVLTRRSNNLWIDKFRTVCSHIYDITAISENVNEQLNFLIDLVRNHGIKIIQVCNSEFAYHVLPLVRKIMPEIKVIDYIHMRLPDEPWDFARLSVHYDSQIDKHVLITQSLIHDYTQIFGVSLDKCVLIRNGIDFGAYNLDKRTYSLGFLGRFDHQKNPLMFLKICAFLHCAGTLRSLGKSCVIAGTGPLRAQILAAIILLRVLMRAPIEFKEPPFYAFDVLSTIDIFIAPSRREGFPMVGLEAMAMGAVVIAPDVAGWGDLIEPMKNGLLVPNNVRGFRRAIERLIRDPELIDQLRFNARRYVEERHGKAEFVQSFFRLYKEMLKL